MFHDILECRTTDYGRLMKPIFNNIPNFWLGLTNCANTFWGIWGVLFRLGQKSLQRFHRFFGRFEDMKRTFRN